MKRNEMTFHGLFIVLVCAGVGPAASQELPAVRVGEFLQEVRVFYTTDHGLPSNDVERIWTAEDGSLRVSTPRGQALFENGRWRMRGDNTLPPERGVATGANGEIVRGDASGLYLHTNGKSERLFPSEGSRSWAMTDVRCVSFDGDGNLWAASPQGVVCRTNAKWRLFTGQEGLPYNDFTCMAASPDGAMWFGTRKGAIRYNGEEWRYRQGLRWVPDDEIRDMTVTSSDGSAWFATQAGVGVIRFEPMNLAKKAKYYEDAIDKYHRRTEYEYVLGVGLDKPGDTTVVHRHDSDNDGLWTSMYGAGQCFAYAATRDPRAKERAKKAFRAMRFLGEVTQSGSHPAPKGFVARSILPTSGRNPNDNDSPQRDRENQRRDPMWKILDPRWPISEDGQWYWKTDTSSDELDGHFFFYGIYFDLVAETPKEKAAVRAHVDALATHLVENDFNLVDHDGTPTRWAVYSPKSLNGDPRWIGGRGLNSLSILAYLSTAQHITGDSKYADAADRLVEEHNYLQNIMVPKMQTGPGTGNQSDDEMAFMSYYNLLRYEKDPQRRAQVLRSMWQYWRNEEPEMCPFFNFVFAAQTINNQSSTSFDSRRFRTSETVLSEAVDQLIRLPLDRFSWSHTNSHRLDILPLPFQRDARGRAKGYRVNGRVLPVDERYFNHWNTDPWALDYGGSGTELGDGNVFLLPYYMGLYHGFIVEQE
ncbi:MAG: two-component regulator propeller domain-containing protein [bacterium]